MSKEVWKDIVGYEGFYQVSNLGNVRSVDRVYDHNGRNQHKRTKQLRREKSIVLSQANKEYKQVCLRKPNVKNNHLVHRLVAETFIPNPENKRTVNHKDGNKHNNKVTNLEWATDKENQHHYLRNNINIKEKKVIIIELDKIFNNARECANYLKSIGVNKANHSAINQVCNGKFKKHKGYTFAFYDSILSEYQALTKENKAQASEIDRLKSEVPNSEDFYNALDLIGNFALSDNPKYILHISDRFMEEFDLIREQWRILNNAYTYVIEKNDKLNAIREVVKELRKKEYIHIDDYGSEFIFTETLEDEIKSILGGESNE